LGSGTAEADVSDGDFRGLGQVSGAGGGQVSHIAGEYFRVVNARLSFSIQSLRGATTVGRRRINHAYMLSQSVDDVKSAAAGAGGGATRARDGLLHATPRSVALYHPLNADRAQTFADIRGQSAMKQAGGDRRQKLATSCGPTNQRTRMCRSRLSAAYSY